LGIGGFLLEITIGDTLLSRSETLNDNVVRSNSLYNMLLGRTTMQKMGMVVSTIYEAVKFHTTQRIETVFSTYESEKIGESVKKIKLTSPANTEGVLSCTDVEENIVVNSKYPEQTLAIGKQLPKHFKERLQNLLRTNTDVFAWTHADMTGITKIIMVDGKPFNTEHKLNDLPQRLLPYVRDRLEGRVPLGIPPKVLPGRLQRLPSDPNGRRGRGQDSILRRRRSLLLPKDALMFKKSRSNVLKTSRQGFNDQIRRNLEAYIDDMVIKITSEEDMLTNIKETFQRFRSINMKFNPKKCSFGIEEGQFLGHLITKQGTRANPSKSTQEATSALQEMKKFMETLPVLTSPIHGDVLMMYLAASTKSIREEGQVPVYFVSRVLLGAELNYPILEKLILALALIKPKKSGRVAKWATELENTT
ncbi:reverse transcriptase domain-containing protein, partial [Tanacetum coccineum]